ncbi:hypothetical protein VMCG_02585 [Cytospora schulzeri]|uniref:G-protein coupled receptors family 1 profile domain-containing protein n=1 Tax=Cytospora schulzeri TaxID=448051 RepID=A0A423X0M0_9PEZI|nr:hypothetical protein VMCG_02585 [Valsa malicola]
MSADGGGSKQMAHPNSGPPYPPTTAALGGRPTVALDDPICACLLLLYVAAAITNMTIFQVNRRRDHKFFFSSVLFGFCMARSTTLVLRIAWASHPTNINLAIAAGIFVQAGVLLLFIVNLVFAQRLLRSYHPRLGWSRGVGWAFQVLYFCVLAMLIMVITATVDSFFTLNTGTRRIDRDIQLFVGTVLAALAFLPIPVTILAVVVPRPRSQQQLPEKFGQGRHRTKLWLLLFTSAILTLGAGFRIGVNFTHPRPATDPAWFHSKPCFYCFNFVIELVVVYTYVISRFDRRFHVPDGSSGPGHYSGVRVVDSGKRKKDGGTAVGGWEVNREMDVFGDESKGDDLSDQNNRRETDWEAKATEELNRDTVGSFGSELAYLQNDV